MDTERFDRLARSLITESSRRTVLALPLLGFATARFAAVTDAKKRKKRCKRGQVRCGKRCVKPESDKNNCGKCGNRCQGELSCVDGSCVCQSAMCQIAAFEIAGSESPGDLAIDADGNIVTAMYFDDKLAIFSPAGRLLREIGDFGDEPGEFDRPESVAVSPDGTLYVADFGNLRIQKIAPIGSIDVWNVDRITGGVAVAPSGAIYATFGEHVHRLNASGDVLYSWGPDGTDATEFEWPGDVAVDSSGDVYVLDEDANTLYRFTDGGAGNIQQHWVSAGPGTGPGEFNLPLSVAVSAGRVFIADRDNYRVQALDSADGSYLFERVIDDDGFELFVVGVAAAQNGDIYVATYDTILTFELGTA